MKMKILCIGGVLQEIIYNTDNADVLTQYQSGGKNKYIAFDFGSKISSNEVWRSFGGGALNSAATFNSMGITAIPVSVVGDDLMGHAIKRYLSKSAISTKYIRVNKQASTAFSFILNLPKVAEHIILVSQGILKDFKFTEYNFSREKADWIYLTSLRGQYASFNIRNIFNLARNRKIKVFWNPGQQQIDNFKEYIKYLGQVDIISLNTAEARDISKQLKLGTYSAQKVAKYLLDNGCFRVIITSGQKGVNYFDHQNKYVEASKKVKVKNTTGAGDAFNAGFLSAYLYDQDIKKALEFGVKNAAAVLQTMGAHEGVLKKKDL
ncbi:MAG: carbohydrate kinase family protein [Candidatus Komeilibacteria bacterium]